MTPKYNLYLGEAGQAAASSYFLARGWNVATPRVDIGDDLLVIEDKQGFFLRIQVKTAQAIIRQKSFNVRFNVSLKQLKNMNDPELYYVFMAYHQNEWHHKIIITRSALFSLHLQHGIGSLIGENLILYFSFQNSKLMCSGIDFMEFYNNFEDFPVIVH